MQQPEHGPGARRRHRRLPGAAAAHGRPRSTARRPRSSTCSGPSSTGQRRLRTGNRAAARPALHAAPRRRTAGPTRASTTRSRCGAASSRADAQARGRGAGQAVQEHGRHQHALPPLLAEADEAGPRRAGTTVVGTVDEMTPNGDRIVSQVRTEQGTVPIEVDFVIDCTGLEADITEHRLLNDLLEHGGAGRNPSGASTSSAPSSCGAPATATARCTPPARPRWAATSPASTRSSACSSPRRRSPTTSPGAASASGSARCARPPVVQVAARNADLRARPGQRCCPHSTAGSRRGSSCWPSLGGLVTLILTPVLPGATLDVPVTDVHHPGHRAGARDRLGAHLPRDPAVPLGEGLADAVRLPHLRQRGCAGLAAPDAEAVPRHRRGAGR